MWELEGRTRIVTYQVQEISVIEMAQTVIHRMLSIRKEKRNTRN